MKDKPLPAPVVSQLTDFKTEVEAKLAAACRSLLDAGRLEEMGSLTLAGNQLISRLDNLLGE